LILLMIDIRQATDPYNNPHKVQDSIN